MSLVLYHMPGACSRVTMNALEEIGLDYEDCPLDLLAGDQRSPANLAVNPRGKVPALLVNQRLLTENAAILLYLHRAHPRAGLLPYTEDLFEEARSYSDLIWCSATVHPVVRSIRMPIRMTDGDPEPVRARGMLLMEAIAATISRRLERSEWWLGEAWSILDVYLYWNYDTARSGGFDFAAYPAIANHGARVRARPSFQSALARETRALQESAISLPAGAEL